MIKVTEHLKDNVEAAFKRLKDLKKARIITVSVNEKHQLTQKIVKARAEFDNSCKLLFGMLKDLKLRLKRRIKVLIRF